MFLCGSVVALLLTEILGLLADVIGLSTEYWIIVLASPTVVIGAAFWWVAIERRDSYTYLTGSAFGLTTALLTGLFWTAQFILLWGVEMAAIPIAAVLIVFVLGFAAITGAITALPLMYVRRRSNSESASGIMNVM